MHSLPSVHNDQKYTDLLLKLESEEDIPEEWRQTPIESFIMSQNHGWPIQTSGKPELLIATCIEFRYALPVPRMYAYVIRRASGRVIGSEFSVGYTMSKGVKHLVMIGHNDCGMAKVAEAAPAVIQSFVDQGWSRRAAEAYVQKHGKRHAIDHELTALKEEYIRLKSIFPKLTIAPLFVSLYDSKLRLPKWYEDVRAEERIGPPVTSVADELIEALP